MHGLGVPLVTPFTKDGDVDHDRLRELVDWLERSGVDFLVPCGSTSEAALLTAMERRAIFETVCTAASVPVLAGTGHPGFRETRETTAAAADAGVDAALVVTPFYYDHGQEGLATYYRTLADESSLPIYLYSVPKFTDVTLEPDTVETLADHPNVVGMKDSSGALEAFLRTANRVEDESFDLLVGSGSMLAQALDAGAAGGILALANLAPAATAEIVESHRNGDTSRAREQNEALVELNAAITGAYGIPGLKWAMRERGVSAGYPRSPHREPDESAKAHLDALLADISL